jgi:hypothetical protein
MNILQNIKNLLGQTDEKAELKSEYCRRLKNYFPTFLAKDVEKVLSIMPLTDEIFVESFGKQYKIDNAIHSENREIKLKSETIILTGRICFAEPNPELENNLTDTQKQILNCIYTRHFDGYIRERLLKNLLDIDHVWILPFKLELLGEFVIEILFELDKHITDDNIKLYKQLTLDNKKHWTQIKSRMVSWWDADYRHPNYKKLKDYIGYKIIKRINKANG